MVDGERHTRGKFVYNCGQNIGGVFLPVEHGINHLNNPLPAFACFRLRQMIPRLACDPGQDLGLHDQRVERELHGLPMVRTGLLASLKQWDGGLPQAQRGS